jgi:hypothetical protein
MRLAALPRRLVLPLCLLTLGCGATFLDPTGRQQTLETTQKKYTELVRWGDLQRASAYVDPELREEFLVVAKQLADLRMSDFDIGEIEYTGEDEVTVVVTYRAWSQTTLLEKQFRETQDWTRAKGLKNVWTVRTDLPAVVAEHDLARF